MPAKSAEKPTAEKPDPAQAKAEEDAARPVAKVAAPSGRRRRAGLSFTRTPRTLTLGELGDDPDATMRALLSDPALSVTPIDPGADDAA